MKRFSDQKRVLPAFPRTPHLPWSQNTEDDDLIAEQAELQPLFDNPVNVEEKIDGASVGMTFWQGHPLIRNRDHILRKGYVKDTPAKKQFAPIWNWFYDNQKKFEYILSHGPLSVYGEWMVARHGIYYDRLPDLFIAYDVYNYEADYFLSPTIARPMLEECGFAIPRLFHQGDPLPSELPDWINSQGQWCDSVVEGLYFKVHNGERITHRFKQVSDQFVRGQFWDGKTLLKNGVAK